MVIEMDVKNVFSDFDWVIRVLKSSETSGHLDCVLNCFKLWESKYSREDKKTIKYLRLEFWTLFKNKSTRVPKS